MSLENVDIFTLASICKEYQVDWLIKKIENYLQEIIPRGIEKTTEQILHYLKLASQMCFDKVEIMLLQCLNQAFDVIQAKDEFSLLNRRGKILVTRKCLWNVTSIDAVEPNSKRILMDTEGFGLLSILKDFEQKPIEMDQQFSLGFSGSPFGAGASFGAKPSGFKFGEPSPISGSIFGAKLNTVQYEQYSDDEY